MSPTSFLLVQLQSLPRVRKRLVLINANKKLIIIHVLIVVLGFA